MIKLFKTIPKSLPPKKYDYYKTKDQTTINAVGGKWYIYEMNSKLPPINRS